MTAVTSDLSTSGATRPQHHASLASSALLPEIWLLVFPYLKAADIQSISLTCSTFRYMAQPLLFSVLDVSPFLLSYNAEQPILRPFEYLERFKKRLEYYQLPHLSHGVRHCWISPYSRTGFPARSQNDNLDPNLIIDAAVEVLPLFTNLSTLSWHCIDIDIRWWNVIKSLRITNLWLNSSSIPIEATSPLPHIRRLDLDQWPWEGKVTNHVSIHEERARGVNTIALQHVIQPDIIHTITVPRVDTACHLFSILSERTYHLQSLKIPFSSITDPNFINALEHCPSLSSLCIFPPSSDERSRDLRVEAFTSSTLPSLENYEGPYTHVLRFSQQPLRNISLWGFDDRPDICDPDKLAEVLSLLGGSASARTIKMLKLTVLRVTSTLLDLFAFFKHLESLIIVSQDSASRDMPLSSAFKYSTPVTSLYTMMNISTLPSSIKYVKVTTRLSSPKQDLSTQEHEAAQFMESFASRHSGLQRMEIEYGIYWTGMYTATWGRIRENHNISNSNLDDLESDESLSEHQPISKVKGDQDGGYSSNSSSKDYILSTMVLTVHPLPLGKLIFTEHRRRILFPQDTLPSALAEQRILGDESDGRTWTSIWTNLKKWFGKMSL